MTVSLLFSFIIVSLVISVPFSFTMSVWALDIQCVLTDNIFDNPCNGTEGSDNIIGSKGSNFINGFEGPDNILGGNRFDQISGGDGNDLINGKKGNDVLLGGEGNDILVGGKGNDFLRGDQGKDTFNCGSGKDVAADFNSLEGDTQVSCETTRLIGTLIVKLKVTNDNGGTAKPSDFKVLIYLGDSRIESPNFVFPGSSEGTKTEIQTDIGINVFFVCQNSDKCANYPTSGPQGEPGDVPEDSRLCNNDPLHTNEIRTCTISTNDPET
jgi:hemolysin type calcium-binding protein